MIPRPRDAGPAPRANGERMGASSGWNLVARRSPRARAASKAPARHPVLVPSPRNADVARDGQGSTPGTRGERTPESR